MIISDDNFDFTLPYRRRFDTSNQLDRSQTFFPDKYVIGIASRIGSVSKGTGAKERIEMGKKNGIRAVFQGIYRPKILSIRYSSYLHYSNVYPWLFL